MICNAHAWHSREVIDTILKYRFSNTGWRMKIPRYPTQPILTKKQFFFLSIPVLSVYMFIIYWLDANSHKHHLQYGNNCNGYNCKIIFDTNDVHDTDLINHFKAIINQARISHIFNRLGGYRTENAMIKYIKKRDPRTFKDNIKKRKIICKTYPNEIGKISYFCFCKLV